MIALDLSHLAKTFGALRATDDLSLAVAENELHAIIGPNGAGKTTLIGQISGEITPDKGNVRLFGEDITGWSVPRRALAWRYSHQRAGDSTRTHAPTWRMSSPPKPRLKR